MPMRLNNKIAIVTGASTGIGRAIAVELAKKSVTVFLVARSRSGLEQTQDLIRNQGGKAEVFCVDLSKLGQINNFISRIFKKTQKIDLLINVAGVWHEKNEVYAGKNFESFKQQVILDTYTVGLTAPTLLAHAFVPLMTRGGRIINISGTFESGAKGWLPYFVSKRATEDLTIGLSEELKSKGIKVNCLSPSDVATEAYKKYFAQYIKEAESPERIAKFAAHLCSDEAENITGKIFVIKKDKETFKGFHY